MRMHQPWIRLLRPQQWVKNAFVFAPLFFAHRLLDVESWKLSGLAALGFLSLSCVVYIVNDVCDAGEDRLHPVKKNRPLAAGKISAIAALLLAVALAAVAAALLSRLPSACVVVGLVYIALNLGYTLWLKQVAIVDVFFLSSYYVLRVLMGCYALQVTISPWIILTTFLLALFLGFGKRYHELGFEEYAKKKRNLQHYNRNLLDRLMTICAGAALITYAIYTADIARTTGKVELTYTTAFVAFGLFRYLQSIYVYHQGGEPESIIFKDKLQLANVAAWLAVTMWILF
jgi:4-hydroxybenzoate polyprenyltransferase